MRLLTRELLGPSALARLMTRYTITEDGCWLWGGATNGAGYGILKIGGRAGWIERCHRIAYASLVAPVEPGVCVLHRCDVRACFNPTHLFLGTNADNTRDMIQKGRDRHGMLRGEQGSNAKLTEGQVLESIDRLLRGDTRTAIAKDMGVTLGAISRIAVGSNWKHLTAGRGIEKSTRGVRRANV